MVNVERTGFLFCFVFFNVLGPWLAESKDVPSANLAGSLQVCSARRQGSCSKHGVLDLGAIGSM